MKILFDTNILLDVLLPREPWVKTSRALWEANDARKISGFITATTITDIFYITRRMTNSDVALLAVKSCLQAFDIIAVNRSEIEEATRLHGKDFEDNLQIACALQANLDAIVTRNVADFEVANISVLTPEQILTQLSNS